MTSKVVTPIGRILVEEVIEERKTSGGIILAGESDPENLARVGTVIYNGIRRGSHPDSVYKEGHTVFFGKFAGGTISYKGKKYISLLESEILAVY